jgi:protein ImuB
VRFACLHLPGFVVQVHVRAQPHLQGTPFAVLRETEGKVARVVAASRGALAEGAQPGLTATQARAVAPSVKLVDARPEAYAAALRALGEAALALSVTVEVPEDVSAGHILALVPPGVRGASFGERLLEVATRLGLVGRVGIADDRFSAWAATQAEPRVPVRAVPAGGAAAFLAPLPLELLPLDPDVRRTLKLLGVHTMGDFAALPPPSVGRRWAQHGVDASTLARGEDRRPLTAFLPVEKIREAVELEHEVAELEPLAFVLRPLCERVATRLAGRGSAAAKVAVTLSGHGGPESRRMETTITIAPARPTPSARTLVDLLRAHLSERQLEHGVDRVAVEVVEEGEAVAIELDLFDRAAAAPGAVDVAVARLRAAFGADAVSGAALADRHRPEAAWQKVAFTPPDEAAQRRGLRAKAPRGAKRKASADLPPAAPTVLPMLVRTPGALRLLDPPAPLATDEDVNRRAAEDAENRNSDSGLSDLCVSAVPTRFQLAGSYQHVTSVAGPTRLEAEWWTDEPLARDYYEVATEEGGRYWLYRDRRSGGFYLHGVFD